MATSVRMQQSISNIAYFAGRIPTALRRRQEGLRYLRDHPEIERAYAHPDPVRIIDGIRSLAPGINVEEYRVDVDRFRNWVKSAKYPFLAYHSAVEEKFLEHFVSVELLGSLRSGLLVDVASWRSYFPTLMRERGFQVIVQDLVYEEGLHGDLLGCNAEAMPLPDESVTAMTLHCSFEHFEGTADVGFIREADRLLRPGGRVVIIPLYLHEKQLTWVDPSFLLRGERIEEAGATWQPAVGYGNRFGRMYSPETFVSRVVEAVGQTRLKLSLVRVTGLEALPSCYLQFAAVLEKD